MTKSIFLVALMILATQVPVSAQIHSNRDLIGRWTGNDGGNQLQLEFFKDSKVMITAPGGRLPMATYKADFNATPISVSLTATDHSQQMVFRGSLEFIDNETIRLTYFGSNSKRKNNFEKGKTIVMKKSK
jgi:hypothetical protein